MVTAHHGDDSERDRDSAPWGGHVDETRLLGDWWFVNRYSSGWWMAATLALVLLPPVGAACLGYMLVACVFHASEDVNAELA